jgi:UDP-GlcNAc3NAcA epimerase
MKLRVLSVVGARPQFVKAAVVCRALIAGGIEQSLIHTGQHYDDEMSEVFFRELGIPAPEINLGVGSASHAVQTADIMKGLDPILTANPPDWMLVYGDTNSTLAAALVASKLGIRQAHVEAGLRSFNRSMPEELNRIVADHLGDLLLCPTTTAVDNLAHEGLAGRAVLTGDVMYDAALTFRDIAERGESMLKKQWSQGAFALATIHRAENTDQPARLSGILRALEEIAADVCPVVLPLHPRTLARLKADRWEPRRIHIMRPVSYLEMLLLEGRARMILTDSGGVQKEAYFMRVPCVTMRDETEWVETQANGCNQVTGTSHERIMEAVRRTGSAGPWGSPYGAGNASGRIVEELLRRSL